jgi:hypothetical protein
MLFLNPQILTSNSDLKIGKVDTGNNVEMSFNEYMVAVEMRIYKLLSEYIKDDMGSGATKEESIEDIARLIHSQLTYREKGDPLTVDELVEEIKNSEEFLDWEYHIKNRFLDTHKGVANLSYQIPVIGESNPNINQDTIDLVQDDDSLTVFIEGLAAKNFID